MVAAIGTYGSLIKDAELEDIEERLSKIEQQKESESHPKKRGKNEQINCEKN
jgi:hypothetical protein